MCYAAVGEAELWCNAEEIQAQPPIFTISLQINLKFPRASGFCLGADGRTRPRGGWRCRMTIRGFQKARGVPSWVRTLPAPSHACALHGPTPSPAPSKPSLSALARCREHPRGTPWEGAASPAASICRNLRSRTGLVRRLFPPTGPKVP